MTIVIWVFVLWFVSIVFASQSIRDILGSRDKSTEYFMDMKLLLEGRLNHTEPSFSARVR
jgi:hypothetical protein